MIDRTTFFDRLSNSVKWDVGVPIYRTNSLPLDSNSVFESMEAAQSYVNTSVAYPGQLIAVVDTNETRFFGIDTGGELLEVGTNVDPVIFVPDESAMLALTDIRMGQGVFREDTHTLWLYVGPDPSNISSWVESVSEDKCVWIGTSDHVNFYALTQEQYLAIDAPDPATLYVITDAAKIYKGSTEVTKDIYVINGDLPANAGIPGKLYIDSRTLEIKTTVDNTSWVMASPGYITDSGNWESADSSRLATVGVIKSGILQSINSILSDQNIAHAITYDPDTLTITIPMFGVEPLSISIPKDKYVTSGTYNSETKNIELYLENQEDPVLIPAAELANTYSANNVGHNVIITIGSDYTISADVDLSKKLDKLSSPIGGKLIISNVNGNIQETSYNIQASGDLLNDDVSIPVGSIIASAITTAISTLQESVDEKLLLKADKTEVEDILDILTWHAIA